MSAQHTPGPWEFAQTSGDDDRFDIFQSKTAWTVARTVNNASITDREANARLIAAAPDLLAALQAACNDIELLLPLAQSGETSLTDKGAKETRSHIALYRAAITKAKGGTR